MYLLCFFSMIWPAFGAVPPELIHREISLSLLTNLTLLSQYSAASSCRENFNSSVAGSPVYCATGYCPLIKVANTEILYAFSGILPGDTTGYIAADHTNSLLLVSFRDTMSDLNSHTDLEFGQMDITSTCTGCRAHIGFWLAAASVNRALRRFIWLARLMHPGYKLAVTGHSLGGAIATIFAAILREERIGVDLYTFGAPSVGNYVFAEFVTEGEQDRGTNYRVTHLDDEIPKVLYRASREPVLGLFMSEYSQSAPEYWITSANGEAVTVGDVQVIDGVNSEEGNLGVGWGNLKDHSWYLGSTNVC